MKVSVYASGKRRFVCLINEHEIPVQPLANAFIYDEFLNASLSTKKRVAYELKVVIGYFENNYIDLTQRISSAQFLTSSEISKFYGQMMLTRNSFEDNKNISVISITASKKLRNAMASSIYNNCKVCPETRTGRIRTIRKYLSFLYDHFHGDKSVPEEVIHSFHAMQNKLKAKENYASSKRLARTVELVESVIPNDIYQKFMHVIEPNSSENPFRSSKLRNFLILSVLAQTGLRRSEVCKIKISDCDFSYDYNKIKVYSSPDDKSDPRLYRPDKKNGRAHISGIEVKLMKLIKFYILHERSKFSLSRSHDFIFITEKNSYSTAGLPITREMVNYILSKVSNAINFKISPHLLRHKWNERLSERAEAIGLEREYTEDLRRNAMGWQPNSQMGRIYNDKHEQLIAIQLMNEHQVKIDGSEE